MTLAVKEHRVNTHYDSVQLLTHIHQTHCYLSDPHPVATAGQDALKHGSDMAAAFINARGENSAGQECPSSGRGNFCTSTLPRAPSSCWETRSDHIVKVMFACHILLLA
jgi:hypothetical protein